MSDEFKPRNQPDNSDNYEDHDVPFRLPRSGEERPIEEEESEEDIQALWDSDKPEDRHNMPTMPIPNKVEAADPKLTLPGSGGMDPNPDFLPFVNDPPRSAANTIQHQAVRLENTMPSPSSDPHQQHTQSITPEQQRFQRPAGQAGAGYGVPPAPPTTGAPNLKAGRLPRRKAARKGCLSPGCLGLIAGFFLIFCGGGTLVTAGLSVWGINRVDTLVDERLQGVDSYRAFQSTFFYDRNGVQLWEAFGEGRRTNASYADFPQHLIDATIAIEDDNFFTNPGIDVPATMRAFAQYVGIGGASTGGSTITQQLVRNVLFDFEYRAERSIQRKVEEIVLALALTQRKEKEEILALYLNEIYYGNLAYGAEAASQVFFGKTAADLTLGEAALLAGLPQAPADLDPLSPNPAIQTAVEVRWRTVLDRMVTIGKITNEQRNEALRQGLTFTSPNVSLQAPHFTVYAQNALERLMTEIGYSPEEIAKGGLQVYTTLDLRINDLAQTTARDQVSRLAGNNVSNAAVIVLRPISGEILAMVGSVDYNNDAIDGRVNVTTAFRQPGSTMKPFTYSAAMEAGLTPGDVIWDTRTSIGIAGQPQYQPRNYDGAFHGPMTMRTALANSYNIPAVQTLRRVGVDTLLRLMGRFGVESLGGDASLYGLSLTLGGGEISLVELTNAYAVFANQGTLVEPTAILCVLDNDDNIVYEYENGCPRGNVTNRTVERNGLGSLVLDPRIAFIISDMLADNSARSTAMGSNSPLYTPNIVSSVKTGTTNDVKDNWTVGYTRNLAVGVWVGNSNGDPMVGSSGLTGAAPIWNSIVTSIYNNNALLAAFAGSNGQLLQDQLIPPNGLALREICDVRRLREPATDCSRVREWFLETPAGIPDGNGGMNFPPGQQQQQPQSAPGQPQITEVSPGVFRVLAFRLDPSIASLIQFPVGVGEQPPPSPIYCQVPGDLAPAAAGAQELLFIAPPPFATDAPAAEQYARDNGLAFLPTVACTPDLLQGGGGFGPIVAQAVISSPQPGDVLSGETPIIGTVQFSPDQGKFYKVEVIGENFGDWVTIGTTHTDNVLNGQLENLYVPGLAPGNYRLRLVIVDNGGGFLQVPYEVPFSVVR